MRQRLHFGESKGEQYNSAEYCTGGGNEYLWSVVCKLVGSLGGEAKPMGVTWSA